MEIEYDLATLAENLAGKFPEITELHLFGSRARGTKSTRSDVDVLVISQAYIKPQLLREFSFDNCEALDLFWVDGGKAISSQNESFIQAEDLPSLLQLLGAVGQVRFLLDKRVGDAVAVGLAAGAVRSA